MSRRIVLVDHGSRLDAAHETVTGLAARLAERLGEDVVACHMEIASPSFSETLQRLAEDPRTSEILVFPLFVVPGKHWREDIEAPVDAVRRAHAKLRVTLLPPLAEQGAFVDFVAARIEHA